MQPSGGQVAVKTHTTKWSGRAALRVPRAPGDLCRSGWRPRVRHARHGGRGGTTIGCVAHVIILERMGTLIQIRDVPEDIHRTLKARAAVAGVSLSEYVRGVLARATSRPTPSELSARIAARGAVEPAESTVLAVREIRDRGE